MKSRWQARNGDDQHPPVEMRFIDMFMTALGSLVFLALILVFLLPKTTQSKEKDEEIQKLQAENQQLKKQIPQQTSQPGGAKTEDKEILLRQFGVLLVTSGCASSQQPDLYVRSEDKIVNFQTNQSMPDAAQFDASKAEGRTILAGHKYFDIGSEAEGAYTVAPLEKGGLHTKLFLGISRGAGSFSAYTALRNPGSQVGKGCTVYPFYLSSRGIDRGDEITLTRQRPFAWLRRFSISINGTNTANISPKADEDFKRDLAEFSKKQSQILCEQKSICGTMDAHYALLVPPPPPPSYAINIRGMTRQAEGKLDLAIADYGEAIKLDPTYVEAWFNRGKAYKAKGDPDQAIADFDEAIRLEPNAYRLNNRGLIYSDKGDPDHAIADYDEALQLDPLYEPAYYNRGNAHSDKGDVRQAISDYNEAIRLGRTYAPAYSNRANAYRISGDFDHAISDYNEAIRREPTATRLNNRGLVYSDKGDLDRAIADYTDALRLDPKFGAAYSNRGNAFRLKNDLDRAITDYSTAIQLTRDKPNADLLNYRGLTYFAKADINHAIADYDAALQIDPKFAVAYTNRGNALRFEGDLDRAIADLSDAIRIEPNAVRYNDRGFAYNRRGNLDLALADFSEAIRRDPKCKDCYVNRGRTYFLQGSLAKAQFDFKQANEMDAKDPYAALWLDLAERRNNISSHLPQYVAKLDMKIWPAPIMRFFLGEIAQPELLAAAQNGDPKSAIKQICEANFYVGELAFAQGSKDESLRLLRIAAGGCPAFLVEQAAANTQLKTIEAKP